MAEPSAWYQQSLTPPDVVEVRARVGIIAESDHLQALVEVFDPITGVLMSTWSSPHASIHSLPSFLDKVVEELRERVENAVEPF